MSTPTQAVARVRSGWALLLIALVCGVTTGCPSLESSAKKKSAQPSSQARATADEQAINSIAARTWYDTNADQYRPPQVSPDRDHPLRRSGTLASPSAQGSSTATGGRTRGFNWPSGDGIAQAILVLLGIALAAVAVVLVMASLRHWKPQRNAELLKAIQIDPARVSDLPFEAQAEMEDPLSYAKHLVSQGSYDDATLFLYGYMLLALDRAGKIVLHRGKTNRMYLQELRDERRLRELLAPAMLAFEDVFFGRHRIEQQRFLKIWRTLDEFHQALAPVIAELPSHDEAGVP